MNEKIRCSDCGKFCKPYDDRTIFGCADPSAPEPYDPDYFCRACSQKRYKDLLTRYKCCYRQGDSIKSHAEVKAAKEAKLKWIGNTNTLVQKATGRSVMNEYIREGEEWRYIPYLEYQKKRREENRCKCWRKKDADGNCPICKRSEISCLCQYSIYDGIF